MVDRRRRSWLIAPVSDPVEVGRAARSGADVVVLDLVELVPDQDKQRARTMVEAAIQVVKEGGAEAFAMIAAADVQAGVAACTWPGLSGLVISRAEAAEQVSEAAAILDRLETKRRVTPRSIHLFPAFETAVGNHAAYEIAAASSRVWGVTLGRVDLVMDLRPEPSGEVHLLPYLMQRLIIIAGALGVTPIGAWWRAPDRGLLASPESTLAAASRGRAIGFKGAMCLRPDQVPPINLGFA